MTAILITRPVDLAEAQAAELARRGYVPILAPCLALRFEDGDSLDAPDIAAFAVTSVNGVRALARRTARRDATLFAVGTATEAAARMAGFSRIERGGGDGASLAQLIAARFDPADGVLLYAHGADIAFDLGAALAARGIAARDAIVYSMPAAMALPGAALAALDDGTAKGVLLMSARTAQAFGALAAGAHRRRALAGLAAICLSPAVVTAAGELGFARIVQAAEPTEAALLAALEATLPPV